MMILIAAAAAAAAQPAAPAPANPQAQHEQHMQMGQAGEHMGLVCCTDCCKDLAATHAGHGSDHSGHRSQ